MLAAGGCVMSEMGGIGGGGGEISSKSSEGSPVGDMSCSKGGGGSLTL